MHTYVEIVVCQHCGAEVDHMVWQNGIQSGSTTIGPPLRRCPTCESLMLTGLKEWDQQKPLQKFWFLLTRLMWLVAGSIVVCGTFSGLLRMIALSQKWISEGQSNVFLITTFCVSTVLLSIVFTRKSLSEIRESKERSRSPEARAMWTEAYPLRGNWDEDVPTEEHAA
jgi:hypothetical protein